MPKLICAEVNSCRISFTRTRSRCVTFLPRTTKTCRKFEKVSSKKKTSHLNSFHLNHILLTFYHFVTTCHHLLLFCHHHYYYFSPNSFEFLFFRHRVSLVSGSVPVRTQNHRYQIMWQIVWDFNYQNYRIGYETAKSTNHFFKMNF